ncbi:MAG: cupin domain-containing protein [Sphingomicrobium sp.]
MDIIRRGSQQSQKGPPDFFTGTVTIEWQFARSDPARLAGALVRFEPGARTAWHRHPLGQTLIVTEGVGWHQCEGEPRSEIRAGDVVWCEPGRRHWHGATPGSAMAHIALQEALDGKVVEWMEKVSDEEYLEGLVRADA